MFKPILENLDIVIETTQSFDYLKSRFSKQVVFSFTAPHYAIPIAINQALHSWTVENLVKNAISVIKGRGNLNIAIIDEQKFVKIYISDSGKSMPKNQFKLVFEPGFTTKNAVEVWDFR